MLNLGKKNLPKYKALRKFKPRAKQKNTDINANLMQGKVPSDEKSKMQSMQTTKFQISSRKNSKNTVMRAALPQMNLET